MIDPKTQKQSRPDASAAPKGSPAKLATMRNTVQSQAMIRERAYQLYESRGCEPGQDEQDWLRAEHEILEQKR
jgi:hypothetical protein